MQETSALYRQLLTDPNHRTDTRLTIGESGTLMTERGDTITFGGHRILVADGGPDSGYDEHALSEMRTTAKVFKDCPSVGNTIAAEIDVVMMKPAALLPRQARLAPYVRLSDAEGRQHSQWLHKGIFFIDTREVETDPYGEEFLRIHGYDAMLRAEADYPPSRISWPARDTAVVQEIAWAMGVTVDPRTWQAMNHAYSINYPGGYSQREVLGIIGAMYGANWFMTDQGELRMARLAGIPKETRLLIDQSGYTITIGGVRIRV